MSKTSNSGDPSGLSVVSSMLGGAALFYCICWAIAALIGNVFSFKSQLAQGIATLAGYPLMLGLYLNFLFAILAIPIGLISLLRNRENETEEDILSRRKTFKHAIFGVTAGCLYFFFYGWRNLLTYTQCKSLIQN